MGLIIDLGFIFWVITYIVVLVDLRGEDELIKVEQDIWKYALAFGLAFLYPLVLPIFLTRWVLISKKKAVNVIVEGKKTTIIKADGSVTIEEKE